MDDETELLDELEPMPSAEDEPAVINSDAHRRAAGVIGVGIDVWYGMVTASAGDRDALSVALEQVLELQQALAVVRRELESVLLPATMGRESWAESEAGVLQWQRRSTKWTWEHKTIAMRVAQIALERRLLPESCTDDGEMPTEAEAIVSAILETTAANLTWRVKVLADGYGVRSRPKDADEDDDTLYLEDVRDVEPGERYVRLA